MKKNLLNDIARTFVPWLHTQIYDSLQHEKSEEKLMENALFEIQAKSSEIHAGFVKKEMEKRKKNHETRVRIQKEMEEAKRKRKERRLAKKRMREKNEIFENLKKFVIAYPSQHNDILEAEVTDITGDKKRKPIGKKSFL